MLVQCRAEFPDVPDGVPLLLGVSVGTSVAAGGLTSSRGSKGAGPESPGMADFISSGGVVVPERFQFFVWTLVGVVGFVSIVLSTDPAQLAGLPTIPSNFLLLMGVSSAGYLAGKTVRAPGPVVSGAILGSTQDDLSWVIEVSGQNLDAAAILHIDQQHFSPEASSGAALTPQTPRRSNLKWTIPKAKLGLTPTTFRVINVDQQWAAGSFMLAAPGV